MNMAARQTDDLDALYLSAKERLRALTIERAQRMVDDPDLYFAPDDRDRELVGQIYAARREFVAMQARYLSARGEYVFLGCYAGEHKTCRREIGRKNDRLVCACSCHQIGGVD
jgi:hypothetical protein